MSERIPTWVTSSADLDRHISRANGLHANMPRASAGGHGIHIGIFDSAYTLPKWCTNGHDVVESRANAYITSDEGDTCGHCTNVFRQVSDFAPYAKYTLYQVVNEDRRLPLTAFSDAITAAIEDGVDIINISCGDPWPGPIDSNPAIPETRRAIGHGITVVAAAGNWYPDSQDSKPPVHCPAALDDAIAVGGLEVYCPATPGDEPTEQTGDTVGPYYVLDDEGEQSHHPHNTSYCGNNGCLNGQSCITNREEVSWAGNPLPTGNKPDVLAPMHILNENQDGDEYTLVSGTSFATPVVSASLANIFSELHEEAREIPLPYEIREAVRAGSAPVDSGGIPKYDAMGTRRALGLA